jgi:signal peptide peptidase SppA
VLVLNTGGGTVTGYGLAAAQLQRLKDAKLPLTICVEQVAASGGYLMACVADEIVAAPFAVLGSIGVITEQPNVYERLTREGISFETITAGKYKRTLTPTKKVDPKDVAKLKDDIEKVLAIFRNFVAKHRPSLDIDKVATGETWIGPDALAQNLVDRLATVDDVLLKYVDAGAEVFGVKYKQKKSPLAALSGRRLRRSYIPFSVKVCFPPTSFSLTVSFLELWFSFDSKLKITTNQAMLSPTR